MQVGGVDIMAAPVRNSVSTGITYGIAIGGLVPAYEEDDARIKAGYTLPAWRALGGSLRAREVAHYRLRHAVELHTSDAQQAAAKRA